MNDLFDCGGDAEDRIVLSNKYRYAVLNANKPGPGLAHRPRSAPFWTDTTSNQREPECSYTYNTTTQRIFAFVIKSEEKIVLGGPDKKLNQSFFIAK